VLNQKANTHDMLVPLQDIISYVPAIMTLLPGDVMELRVR
jgi:2-keto-4-pentenoate hydratase/2-oxohepta-3-ene-1,7-dioic acid hydratase in catechol pathway